MTLAWGGFAIVGAHNTLVLFAIGEQNILWALTWLAVVLGVGTFALLQEWWGFGAGWLTGYASLSLGSGGMCTGFARSDQESINTVFEVVFVYLAVVFLGGILALILAIARQAKDLRRRPPP